MEKRENNIIKVSLKEWNERKKRLGFSVEEPMPEDLQAKVRIFFLELIAIQSPLYEFENPSEHIPIIIETFSAHLEKIKELLHLLDPEYQDSHEYKGLQYLSTIIGKFLLDLKQSTLQNTKQIILDFRENLSKII